METEDMTVAEPQDAAQQDQVSEATAQPETVASGDDTAVEQKPYKGFAGKLDKFFGIRKNKSTFRAELIGGLITFMAMVYILPVNAGMLSMTGPSFGAIYIATALSAIVGTMLMALLARMPMAQASGMGLNAFFVFTICFGFGLSYANALVLVLIDGVVFILLTVTGLRKMLFNAIPKVVRIAIPAGIGLFIAFIGMQNVGLITTDASIVDGAVSSATIVKLASFNLLPASMGGSATYGSVMPLIVTIVGIIAVAIMAKKKVKGAVLWALLGGTALYWLFMAIGYGYGDAACKGVIDTFSFSNPIDAFKDWGTQSVGQVFANGFNFDGYLATHNGGSLTLVIITSALAFCMVDMFDTMGTLYGACARGNMLEKDGGIPNINNCMLCDAIATTTGAVAGTSTVTTFVESSAGIGAGARTGFASLITAGCFLLAMFLSPIAEMIPSAATSIALIYVGVLMMNCVREIEWTDAAEAVPAFLTIAMMPLTYNISYGIAFGIISWLLIKIFVDLFSLKNKDNTIAVEKKEKINVVTVVIAVLFILMFFLTH
ncbi:MAG: NCS2 family permease [Clostridiales bacterium]|nr:NCS2 family permease [Clostridiales bacterium]